MKRKKIIPLFFSVLLLMTLMIMGQRPQQNRPAWSDRSPAIGKIVPDVTIYDQDLDKIPFSNLYKNSLLVIQWGGCT